MNGPWHTYVAAYFDHSMAAIALGVFRHSQDRTVHEILGDSGWVTRRPGEFVHATAYLDMNSAKKLAEDLHASGAIPDSELQSEGHKGALEFHLADMRRLLAQATGAPLPERKP